MPNNMKMEVSGEKNITKKRWNIYSYIYIIRWLKLHWRGDVSVNVAVAVAFYVAVFVVFVILFVLFMCFFLRSTKLDSD